jgi:hypothetical protein
MNIHRGYGIPSADWGNCLSSKIEESKQVVKCPYCGGGGQLLENNTTTKCPCCGGCGRLPAKGQA